MYSHVRLPIQPSLILTRIHFAVHGSLFFAYLTVPLSAWLYLLPVFVVQAHSYRRLRQKQYLFQKQKRLQLNREEAQLIIDDQLAIDIRKLKVRALWSSFVIIEYCYDQTKHDLIWIHQSETDAEAFRKLKVMASIGRLKQKNKRMLQ